MIEIDVAAIITKFVSVLSGEAAEAVWAGVGIFATVIGKKIHNVYKTFRQNKKNSIPKLIECDITVYKYLTELLVETGADRAFIIQFHNGMYYNNHANQMKMSCTHEIVKDGISRESRNMQNILISRFPSAIQDIISKPFVKVELSDDNPTTYLAQLLREQGVTKCIASVMKDGAIAEGFVAVSYLEYEDRDCESVCELVKEYSSKIGFILRVK